MNIVPPPPNIETYEVEGRSVVVEEYESSEEELMPGERDIINQDDITQDLVLRDVIEVLDINPVMLPKQKQAVSSLVLQSTTS